MAAGQKNNSAKVADSKHVSHTNLFSVLISEQVCRVFHHIERSANARFTTPRRVSASARVGGWREGKAQVAIRTASKAAQTDTNAHAAHATFPGLGVSSNPSGIASKRAITPHAANRRSVFPSILLRKKTVVLS